MKAKFFGTKFFIAILVTSLAYTSQAQRLESPQIDTRKSLIVTELSILKNFTLKRTMDQLADQAKVPGLTGEKLFRQWFDILNPQSEAVTSGPHCDDTFDELLSIGLFNTELAPHSVRV